MGFLSKLKKKPGDEGLPPPPPSAAAKKPVKAEDAVLPPLPTASERPAELPELPPMPQMPDPEPDPEPMPPPAPKEVPASPSVPPPLPQMQAPEPPRPAQEPPRPPRSESESPRQQMRDAFNDLPPIKIDADDSGVITKDQVSDLDVDELVLPGQETPEPAPAVAPLPKPEPLPAPIPEPAPQVPLREPVFTGPLYVDVQTYEDVQKAIRELKTQLGDIDADVQDVRKLTEKEDKQFSVVVKKLERIQEDILRVDQDLFEDR